MKTGQPDREQLGQRRALDSGVIVCQQGLDLFDKFKDLLCCHHRLLGRLSKFGDELICIFFCAN
jgi:hypothetical protein